MDKDLKNRLIAIRQNLGLFARIEQGRWHVKNKLGICADFYSLKHSNLDEVSEMAGLEIAKKLAGHTNINTTKIYTIGESSRQSEIIKGIKNKF